MQDKGTSATPESVINIVIAPDNNVIAPACVLLNSIKISNPREPIVIHLLYCELSQKNLDILHDQCEKLELGLNPVELDNNMLSSMSIGMNSTPHLTPSSLLRCFIGSVLPRNIKRIIYLDIDIVVVSTLSELHNMNLKGKICAAVLDRSLDHLEQFGVAKEFYFNSGVMVIDVEKWRENLTDSKLASFMKENGKICIYNDQCALNAVLFEKVLFLDPKWNVMSNVQDVVHHRLVSIIHYAGSEKPWHNPRLSPYGIFYCNFSKDTPWPTPWPKYTKEKRPFSIRRIARKYRRSIEKRFAWFR